METRSKSKLRGPLPGGDRRGTPGADAGCHSEQSVSGEELSRRAPTGDLQPENATADNHTPDIQIRYNSPTEPYSPSTASYHPSVQSSPSSMGCSGTATPTLDVAREANAFLPASTKAGKPRVRMKWSNEVNLFIMRTYFYITKLESDLTMYRQKLYQYFIQKYPGVNVSEQRLSDQRRTIVKNKLLTQETLDRLREEVKKLLEEEEVQSNSLNSQIAAQYEKDTQSQPNYKSQAVSTTQIQPQSVTFNQSQPSQITQISHTSTQTESVMLLLENEVETLIDNPTINDTLIQQTHETFRTALNLYSGMDPASRPFLPKLRYSHKLSELVLLFNNSILPHYLTNDTKLTDLHTIIYCSASVITKELNVYSKQNTDDPKQKGGRKPPWQRRLETDIEKLRQDIGRLTQYINNNRSRKIVKAAEAIFQNLRIHTRHESNNRKPEEFLDTLKQKLNLKVNRLKRYTKAQQRKTDNRLFIGNEKMFYRRLTKSQTDTTENDANLPTKEQLELFWAGIWEEQIEHNTKADWIVEEETRWTNIEAMPFVEITELDITNTTAKLHNWKSPGIDKIHNFWYKKFTVTHKSLAINLTSIILKQQSIPQYIATGITYMLPKSKYVTQPSEYRPITCLPTMYKILTSVIASKINQHIEQHNIIAEEQKGCRRGHMGCKEQLVIDSTIHKHASVKNRNLHCSYIDYKKAFDSIPHSWLLKILEIYKINPIIIDFLKNIMLHWKTTLHLNSSKSKITTRQIDIKKGIYQGDSLSPLWFCLALNPLSHLLHNCRSGYRFNNNNEQTTVSHLIYMDDIKLYSKTDKEMKELLEVTTQFSKDINMQFGLDKCKTIHIIKGKIKPGNYQVNESEIIAAMDSNSIYKYLGYTQRKGINHTTTKNTLTQEYKTRLNKLCKTSLSGKNLIKSINTFAIPILTYSFGIIKWTKSNILQIERTTRTTLTKHNHLHPNSAIERLTIKRQHGGRGLIDIHNLWQKQINNLKTFFLNKSNTSEIHKAITQNDHNYTPLNLEDHTNNPINTNNQEKKIEEWKKKVLHGRHPHDLHQTHVDAAASNKWLVSGNLFPETEGFIIAIQDQIINTKNYRRYIIKDPTATDDKCRKCHSQPETIQHITGACTTLTQTDYTHRHNQVVNIIHQEIALKHKLIQNTNTPYYNYKPQTILENSAYKLYYDRAILTDRTVHYNRPDITLTDKTNKTTYIIDIAVPNTHNVQKTITEKITKYIELKDEITRIWRQDKVYVVPIVISTTGVIPNHLRQSLKLIGLKDTLIMKLQKAAILNTCRIVRKFMQLEENQINP